MKMFGRIILVAALSLAPSLVFAQGYTIPTGTPVLDHLIASPAPGKVAPVGVGCTILAGSTDDVGQCTASTTSGTITFATPYVTAPFCTVADQSATPTAVVSVSATAITLTTIVNAHVLVWNCRAKTGG